MLENAITIVGEEDGVFNDGDYITLYGRGSSFRDYDQESQTIKRFNHPYSNKSYYWMTFGEGIGKRIQYKTGLNLTPNFIQTSSNAFIDYEEDKINLGNSGRQYFGDNFSSSIPSRTYLNTLNGRLSNIPIRYKLRFVSANPNPQNFNIDLRENGILIYSKSMPGYSTSYTVGIAYSDSAIFSGQLPDNKSVLKFNYSAVSELRGGYLDYFEILFEKELRAYNNSLLFFSKDTTAIVEYILTGFPSTDIKVYDVTDHAKVSLITNYIFLSGGECRFQINETKNAIRKYLAIGDDTYLTPKNPLRVDHSDYRGIRDGAKFIIITHKNFLESANKLKTYRELDSRIPISTLVFDVEKIYNEFSCGVLDVLAIRDFLRYAYINWTTKPEYVLLLGKGTYDYKNIDGFNDNFIPTWQSVESLRLLISYTTDDFFARIDGDNMIPDISIGRLPVTNLIEANNCVGKIKYYENESQKGTWQNLITLVADDGMTSTGDDGEIYTNYSEIIASDQIPGSYDLKKIYLAEYPAIITGSGRRKPDVNKEIISTINSGVLLINYIGHGNPEVWAHENVFERSFTIPQLINKNYFFLTAATCDFGQFDIPNFQSSTEQMIFLENSGSISSLTATRLVIAQENQSLNEDFIFNLLRIRDTLNLAIPTGLATFKTKLIRFDINDQKFHLFGDPTLRLLTPQFFGSIDSINGLPLIDDIQIKALSKTRVSGTILEPDSSKWTGFNGIGLLTVFDSERIKYLQEIDYNVIIPGGIIFRGTVSINNGEFEADFTVPKDISYENKHGKINLFFKDFTSDGIAFTNKITVGGTDTTVFNDGDGPQIEIFFDEHSSFDGYLVGPTPKLTVVLQDETGINTTGTGVGHKLEGILNENINSPIDFTNYFIGDLDAGGLSGQIDYNFHNLEEGDYSLDVKARDVFNNFSKESAYFTVVTDNDLIIRDVYNYPNPFTTNTTFTFQQNLDRPINVDIKIYTIAGRLIKKIEMFNLNEKFVKIDWDGRDEDGDQIANGTYLYKLIVRTVDGDFSNNVLGKMAVIK